ncbi:MAG: accessory Sec system protein Asp1 [Eubacterium sp.]|nr:accessory Sec system protein Asp1 [Eubacterium sp.]
MFYFIPSWYNKDKWTENEPYWYIRREHTEFDDTVKQMQLFGRNSVTSFRMIILSFTPNFRHFLHRQGVYHLDYWSCFDTLCDITAKKPKVFSFHDMNWPEGIEFMYSQFAVLAYLNGEKYAKVEFAEDGNPIEVDLYSGGEIIRKNVYDDRGILSLTETYKSGKVYCMEFRSQKGTWRARHYEDDGHVEINPEDKEYHIENGSLKKTFTFSKEYYDSFEELIKELLNSFAETVKDEDIFCIAMHNLHIDILREVLENKKKILSFYEDRYDFNTPGTKEIIEDAGYIITDSNETTKRVENAAGYVNNIIDITPYDSRVDFGISHQLMVQKILVPVDDVSDELFENIIKETGNYLTHNENAQVHLFTRLADYDIKERLLEKTGNILKENNLQAGWATEEEPRFIVEQCVDELSVSRCMREQRIVVDLRKVPELYLQITAISAGIPQIVARDTEYISDGENGFVIKDISELGEKLDYYLGSMANWNQALIYSYELTKKYTTKVLVKKWKGVIKQVEQC